MMFADQEQVGAAFEAINASLPLGRIDYPANGCSHLVEDDDGETWIILRNSDRCVGLARQDGEGWDVLEEWEIPGEILAASEVEV